MISLVDRLKETLWNESLLDDEEELLDNIENVTYDSDLKNPNGQFRRVFKFHDSLNKSYYKDNTINIISNNVIYNGGPSVVDIYPNTKKMKINGTISMNKTGIINQDIITKKLECVSLNTKDCGLFKDLNILISTKLKFESISDHKPISTCVLNNKGPIEFNNVFLKFDNNLNKILLLTPYLPIFNNFRSNCKLLIIHHSNIFENIKKDIKKIFKFPYTTTLSEYGVKNNVEIKNFRQLRSMLSSYKYKYIEDSIFDVNDNFKLNDLIDLKDAPFLNCIIITDGVDCLQFDKEDHKYNDHGNILGQIKNVYTKDKWRVTIFKYKNI